MDCENKPHDCSPIHGGERPKQPLSPLVRHYIRKRLAAQPRVRTVVQVFTVTGKPAVTLFTAGYMSG